jgi:hypothetical protein
MERVENHLSLWVGTFWDFGEMKLVLVNNYFVIYLTVLPTDRMIIDEELITHPHVRSLTPFFSRLVYRQ